MSDFFIISPQCHLAAISPTEIYLQYNRYSRFGTAADQPVPPTVELLQSLKENDFDSAQQN